MSNSIRAVLTVGFAWIAFAPSTHAQATKAAARPGDTAPVIVSVSPPSATIGGSAEWTVNGRNLGKVERWIVSGEGVSIAETRPGSETRAVMAVHVAAGAEPGFRHLRAVGPNGVSNLALVRIDTLPQTIVAEPATEPEAARPIAVGSAVAAVLKPQHQHYYRIRGEDGRRVTIEVEAQRLGTAIVPVVSVLSSRGASLAQAGETRGTDRDSRLSFTCPATGDYLIQVRDNLYTGGDSALYRLRVAESPYATGLFPLGGRAGTSIVVTASGGSLEKPVSKTVVLPETSGAIIDVGPFEGGILSPARLHVGGGDEIEEQSGEVTKLSPGATANGRIAQPGEVDRYRTTVKKGDVLAIRVRAAALGSWLDSVVTLRDADGKVLAERDDLVETNVSQPLQIVPNSQPSLVYDATDTRFDYPVQADGDLFVEVTDRSGDGGPEFGYRLEVGPARPDVAITLLLDPNLNAARQPQVANRRNRAVVPGTTGALNLRPASSTAVNFLVSAEGKTGPIIVSAEGLPPGVTAAPVTLNRAARPNANGAPEPLAGALNLRAAPDAVPELGELRVVAGASPEGGVPIARTATGSLTLEVNPVLNAPRPVTRVVSSLPVRVLGERPASALIARIGPPVASGVEFKGVKVGGPLLLGERVDLTLEFDPPLPKAGEVLRVEAKVEGRGLAASTLPGKDGAMPVVRVLANVNAPVGPSEVAISVELLDGETATKTATVEVRAPIVVKVDEAPLTIEPGGKASLPIVVERATGYNQAVNLKVVGLPPGVKVVGRPMIAAKADRGEIVLMMAPGAPRSFPPASLRVVGEARVARGKVEVEAANRPMLSGRIAED